MKEPPSADQEQEERKGDARSLLEESRVLLPGIQAIFGFQLIAVFSYGFKSMIPQPERVIHYIAVGLTALTIALVLAPVAYHRQNEPRTASPGFLRWAGRALAAAMAPLALAFALELHVVGYALVHRRSVSIAVAATILATYILLWFVLPAAKRGNCRHIVWDRIAPGS